MANRHALLIGVPFYDDAELNDECLGAAFSCDMRAMRAALEQSHYEITDCGSGDAERGGATLNRINQAIEQACGNAPSGGVLLIYFSGHGVKVDGIDYLIPNDAYRRQGNRAGAGQPISPPAVRSLVPVVPDPNVLAGCRAALVVFFVDACRNDPVQDAALPGTEQSRTWRSGVGAAVESGGQHSFLAGGGQFVLVMGCGIGQVCQYDETGSAFTQALAKALDTRHPARTLDDVVTAVTHDMATRSRQAQGEPQVPAVQNPRVLEFVGQVPVCDGDELSDAWRKAVEASPLLSLCVLPDQVHKVVAECAARYRDAGQALEDRTGLKDPWTDQNYPGRVLRGTELLLEHAGLVQTGGERGLLPGEAAMLVAAPFLREAVLAAGIRDAAGIDPASFDRTYTPGNRSDLELTHEMHQHLVRRAIGLRLRAAGAQPGAAGSGGAAASDQLAMWLVHRWLAGRVRLWESPGAADVYRLAEPLIKDCRGSADPEEVPLLVQALLLAVGAEPADERLLGKLEREYVGERWRFVAAVLWLSGIIAGDLRRLPPAVPDLVGTGMEVPLADVQHAAGQLANWQWRAEPNGVDLHLACEHPALHDAFEDIVSRADTAAKTITARLRPPKQLGAGLPSEFSAAGLRPKNRRSLEADVVEKAYDIPLSRFQIAEEKVRELLMGRQLYGEPALAIRELYQNALDACRWRATRQEYRHRKHGDPADWAGLIRFTQSTDGDGRPYIECEDNGVGMDLNTLKHVFANAGERFVYGQEFRAEQAAWAELDPPLGVVSNSQFGVGVFSYFMLADEITVTTRHQGRDGVAEPHAYEVRIASSGSLFQIRPAPGLAGGGTRVRLYLSGDSPGISVLATLRGLLWIAEHRVVASDWLGEETWEPGELRYPGAGVKPLKCGEDLWWVPGMGGLAADGIITDVAMSGLVVNLRGEHRPQFTVDRKTLRAFDADWVVLQFRKYLPDLMGWSGFTLSWLWEHARAIAQSPSGAGHDLERLQQIFEHAISVDVHIAVSGDDGGQQKQSLPLRVTGCVASDADSLDAVMSSRQPPDCFRAWRAGVWRSLDRDPRSRLMRSADEQPARLAPEQIAGFPVPDAIDGAMLDHCAKAMSLSDAGILSAMTSVRRTPREGLRRLRRYAIVGIDFSKIRGFSSIDVVLSEDDIRLIRVLPDWTAAEGWTTAEETQRAEFVQALVKAGHQSKRSPASLVHHARVIGVDGWCRADPQRTRLVDEAVQDAHRIWSAIQNQDPETPFAGDLSPAALVAWGRRPGMSMDAVLERCDYFTNAGYPIRGAGAYPAKLEPIELSALQHVHAVGVALSVADLLLVAADAGVSLRAAYDALARLEQCGLLVRPELNGQGDYDPTPQDVELINRGWRKDQRFLFPQTKAIMRRRLWMRVAQIIKRPRGQDEDVMQSARCLAPLVAPTHPVTYPELAQASWQLEAPLARTATALGEVYPGIRLPDLPAECGDLIVADLLHDLLLDDGEEILWQRPAPYQIVRHARSSVLPLGDFLARLARFRAIGALVPPCTEAIREMLREVHLDDRDEIMLKSGDYYVLAVWPLHLVQTAGRFGWTLAEAHERFARLAPIGLRLDYPQGEVPDEIVYWYDLQALTTHFDGGEPVISGRMGRSYLKRAAEQIFDAAPDEIPAKASFLRERLAIYARLFELDLDTLEEDSVA